MFEVIVAPDAQRIYDIAERSLTRKIDRCFVRLETDPRSGNNVKQLKGQFARYYRYRVGDWRVIYRVDDQSSQVIVVDIAHRSEVYD